MSQSPPQSPPVNKKWYEDNDLTVTENTNAKVLQRQSEFGPGVIGTEFNAIKVKLQETYEIGILKLFIETEILKSGSGSFETGLKDLYIPQTMTKPLIGKDLLFTSDVEFSEAGFLPGSLQDDRRKYFLIPLEFNKYLLRLPKPISDIETPIKEKTDSNAYKYLQVLGNEESNKILMICENFKRHNDDEQRKNANAIIKLQKELDNAKKLVVDANMTQARKTKLEEDIDRQLTNEKKKKIRLETKYINYKAACKILSNVVKRMQYDAMLVESYPATIKDGNSLSTTIVDWLKYKQNSPNFFREVLSIFKPTLSIKAQTDKDVISDKIDEVVKSLSLIFKSIIEIYFYYNLNENLRPLLPVTINPDDSNFLRDVVVLVNRTNDPEKYSWKNISSVLERVLKLRFDPPATPATYDTASKLYIISNFMLNFQPMLLRIFTFNKKDGGIEKMIQELTTSESALNTIDVVNMLYHNIVYLEVMLTKIIDATQRADIAVGVAGARAQLLGLIPRLLPEQRYRAFNDKLVALRDLVPPLEVSVRDFRLTVQRNSYKTILGEASHAAFVESIFSEKSPPISHANRNNKFLVVSDFITDAYNNANVVITIPDNYYDLETLGSAIEKELCDKCKWRFDAAVPIRNRDTIWTCKYDENKKMQLKLYFPENELMKEDNIIPNIHDEYPAGFINPAPPNPPEPANNSFQISGGYIRQVFKTLTIPGEYRNIEHLLEVMEKTINDFIGDENNVELTQAYKTKMVITLDAAVNRVKFEFKSTGAAQLRLARVAQAAAVTAIANAQGLPQATLVDKASRLAAIAKAKAVLLIEDTTVAGIRRSFPNPENEVLTVTLNNQLLSIILGSTQGPIGGVLPPFLLGGPSYIFNSAGPTRPAPAPLVPSDQYTMQLNPPAFPRPSKSVQIKTRMQIDGDEYDASAIFGVPSSVAPVGVGVITITPEITIRELALSTSEKDIINVKMNEMLADYLGFSRLLPPPPGLPIPLERISDYGILNFTGGTGFRVTVEVAGGGGPVPAITTLDAVDLSKIVSKANNGAKIKTELMEKTGLYINNSLLHAKVPVITSTDILNSLFYRYPCIPSPEIKDVSEGTLAFDKFIEERVNVSKFKEVVWLGKGINDTSEPLSLTIRKALDKTLMYDDCDEERSKLMCDLHYAICGPVFSNTVLKQQNQYGETDELEMFHQFQLEIKRPDILSPAAIAFGGRQPRPIVKPFTVKGITPYYDAANERYKYLIYGHYLDFTIVPRRQIGCVKYYDPGTKLGPQPTSMQLYDILSFNAPAGGPTTVNSVVEVNFNKDDESFIYPIFQIFGNFNSVTQYDVYGFRNPAHVAPVGQNNIVLWTPGKMDAGLPFNNVYGIYLPAPGNPLNNEMNRIAGALLVPSNSFDIFWNVTRQAVPVPPPFPPSTNTVDIAIFPLVVPINPAANWSVMFTLNVFIQMCHYCMILKSTLNDDNTLIYLPVRGPGFPYNEILRELAPVVRPFLKITCGAVSINKDVFNTTKKIHFYQREYLLEVSSMPPGAPAATPRLIDIQNKIDELNNLLNRPAAPPDRGGLKVANDQIANNMLWIGLKEQSVAGGIVLREILSCTIIDQNAQTIPLNLPITFLAGDFIEKIKVDINDPEIVTVFGKFTATIQDIPGGRANKTIQNVMVIYTNLENDDNNNRNYGRVAAPPLPPAILPPYYSLRYDNFQPLTINETREFTGYYSCVDGLIVASHVGGTMQQNMGTLLVKKTQAATPVIIGFHDHKITEITTIDEQYSNASDIWSSILCYDYNMCADIIGYEWNVATNQGKTLIDKGLFNPLSFNAFKTTLKDVDVNVVPPRPVVGNLNPIYVYTTNKQTISELFNGEFVLVTSKQSRPTNALSKLHVLNTWGIDLSNESTPFYKRIEKGNDEGVNMTIYEMYINKVVNTIIGSAKKYYEDKIKNSLYDEEYGIITSSPPSLRFRRQGDKNAVITGGGRREDAAAMIIAKQIELEEMKKLQIYNKNNETREIKSTIEIRIPDIMMSDAYLGALSSPDDKDKARKYFFDALCTYSKKVKEIAIEEYTKNSNLNRERGNVVIKDIYKVVLCSSKVTEFKFDNMYEDKKVVDQSIQSVLSLSPSGNLYDYEDEVTDGVKNIILVNEWNDRGFIGDYGAFADSSSLTPNQMIISKTMKVNPPVPPAVNPVVEFIPKIANSSFLLNPFITYWSFDSSRWTGINSLELDDSDAVVVQVGGTYEEDQMRMYQQQLIRQRQQQEFQNGRYGLSPQYGVPYGQQYGVPYGQQYGVPYGQQYGDDDGMRQVLEKTNVLSKEVIEDRTKMMRPDVKVKRVVLWLCNFREGKMLMEKTLVGSTKIMLSLPTQKKNTGADNVTGYALLQELCKKYFQTEAFLKGWTFQHTYISSSGTGIFIYSAKMNELPKETTNMVYVSMNAIYKVATATSSEETKNDGKEIVIIDSDKPIIVEIFKVVKLISGGIISSTSKEYNDVLARLGSKTVPPHLRSVISATKRKKNVEANVNFLIKLFFSPNNLFFIRGNAPYYIYSSQRTCKISNMIKQPGGYDDDSYLTCLKLFLQTETDFKNKDKDSTNNFRVGCAVKKKLITNNLSAVWDTFWGDLIESEEESKLSEQLAEDVGEKGTEEGKKREGKVDDKESSVICLRSAVQSGVVVYSLASSWNVSNYWPIKYNDVYYNIRENEQYRFNNEFFYDLHLDEDGGKIILNMNEYVGFRCIAYHNNKNNPVLFLGELGEITQPPRRGRVYKLDLKTHKLTTFIETNAGGANENVVCMDILDVDEQDSYMLVGGNFTQITTFNDANVQVQQELTRLPVVLINLSTYEIILLYAPPPAVAPLVAGGSYVTKVSICKTKKIVKAKGIALNEEDVEGYIALIGGVFQFDITNDNNVLNPFPRTNREFIENIGCVLIRKNPDPNNPNTMQARLVAIDTKVACHMIGGVAYRSGIRNVVVANFNLTSIICQENKGNTETVFFIGGCFDTYQAIDYVDYNARKAVGPGRAINLIAPQPPCNGIIKLKLKCEYDDDDNICKYNQASEIEPIIVDAPLNRDVIYASLQYGIINSKKYLFCLTAFLNVGGGNVDTMLNVYDIESTSNLQMPMPPPIPPIPRIPPIPVANYRYQTLLLTKDNDNHNVLIMSFSRDDGAFHNYTYTCNVSSLGAAAPIQVIAAASENIYIDRTADMICDMFYREDTGEVFIAHMFTSTVSRTGYPLTIRSNHQPIGEWKLKSASTEDASELEKFNKFMDKVFEMRKIFNFNPSMILFLQDVDFRDYDDVDSKITKTILDKMKRDLIAAALFYNARAAVGGVALAAAAGYSWFIPPPPAPPPAPPPPPANVTSINMDSPCNNIDETIKNIMQFIDALNNPGVDLIRVAGAPLPVAISDAIAEKIYKFVNDLLFMLVYTGCNELAQSICKDYVNLVITPPALVPALGPGPAPGLVPGLIIVLSLNTWRNRFNAVLSKNENTKIKELIDNIGKKVNMYKAKSRLTPDTRYNFKICSDPDTHTGVSYLEYNYNQNLNSLISLKNQNNLKNRIYDSEKGTFFSSNQQFHMDRYTDYLANAMEQINFCSFYKFDRLTFPPLPINVVAFGNIGNQDSDTIYVSVDINGEGIKSGKVFEFLNIIRVYFMNLKTGIPDVDIGISGQIKRIIFGGDFGCNLLNDVEVCRKFKSNKMKIYTMEKNNSVIDDGSDGNAKNQIFMIDVDLEQAQAGGGNHNHNNQKRICIGERIEEDKRRVLVNKRKTRRKVPLMLSSS